MEACVIYNIGPSFLFILLHLEINCLLFPSQTFSSLAGIFTIKILYCNHIIQSKCIQRYVTEASTVHTLAFQKWMKEGNNVFLATTS